MKRSLLATVAAVGIFLVVQLGALALVEPFMDAGYQAVDDPGDPTNSLLYIGAIVVITGVMLAAIKLGVDRFIQALIVFASVLIAFYVFSVVLPAVIVVGGVDVVAAVAAIGLGVALLVYPEWYVIDSVGIVMGAGAAGLFGISFGLLPAIVLLVALAVYDAISVYGTEHMLTLASGVMDLRLPIVLVIPLTLSYSFLEEEGPESLEGEPESERLEADADADAEDGDADADQVVERDALFIGLGDAIVPTILVASAAFFRPGGAPLLEVPGIALTVPALGAMIGTIAGLLALLGLVLKGRAHAGLPLLNGGAIAGYLLGAAIAGITVVDALGLSPYL